MHECDNCLYVKYKHSKDDCMDRMLRDAAAAIEELQSQLPKRGEIVRCGECRWVHICRISQHLGLDGFCSKGEREVQDGENKS